MFYINLLNPEVFCKVFEDNKSFIAVVDSNKLSPRTKHTAIKYHHLQRFVQKNISWILYIDTREQTADNSTKPLNEALFVYLQRELSVW